MNSLTIDTPSRAREPGLWRSDPYLERYRVAGGGAAIVALQPGDELTVVDPEGRQVAEVVPFGPDGRPDPMSLTDERTRPANGLRAILGAEKSSSLQVKAGLERRGIDLAAAQAITLFAPDSLAGEEAHFVAARKVTCAICALGSAMLVSSQNPPTALVAWIRRSDRWELTEPALPEPLADPRLDFRIAKCTAQGYEVREGEYVQIIDVAGRECSDFLAFDRRLLGEGLERGLDTTVTRTLMGAAYPGPGLFSKYFDQDMQPLVEVVRDTVGRHDTFGLACTSKYYENMGYFGHANCSDNLSAALADYPIASRRAWPAINFFYNTGIDDDNVLYLDEPWSRPGDYVLVRALTDLVCASSACPDDTSAANAWNPTDIHVRVYGPEKIFSKAIDYRMTADSDPKLTEETGFHSRTAKHTRSFIEYRGYWLPSCFTGKGAIDEYWACREKAVIMDLSPLRKFEVLGPDAEALVQYVLTRNARKLAIGQVVYSAMCYPHGGMLDDGTLFRLGPDNFRWIGGIDYDGAWMREQAEQRGYKVWVKSSTDQIHNVSVQGPLSRDILKDVVWTPPTQPTVGELEWFCFTVGRIGDFNGIPVMVSRTGYTGELGFEIFCHPTDAAEVWDAVWEAGQPHDLTPMGLDALDLVRIEAGLVFADYEFSDETDPFEAGIGFTVPLKTKAEDFVGREALVRRKANPQRKLVGLELRGNEPAKHGDCVHVGRAAVGIVTSAMRSPILKKNIALCRIDVIHSQIGTEIEVGKLDGGQKRIPATVVPIPFYDPKKERVRA
jgi:aminomethyltransferase